MREIAIDESIAIKIKSGKKFFYQRDLPSNFPSIAPGEWFVLKNNQLSVTSFGNPYAKDVPVLWVIEEGALDAWELVSKKIDQAISRRSRIYRNESKRLVYGQSDGLPGLVVDTFETHTLIQINTAGIDVFREKIKTKFDQIFPNKRNLLLDNPAYRQAESLPVFQQGSLGEDRILIFDSGFEYELNLNKVQKLGFYFDHRDNRNKYEQYIKKYYQGENWNALDLFCYLGAWGLHSARAGAKHVTFVDQADMATLVNENINKLNVQCESEFIRSDVFDYLDKAVAGEQKFKSIICDPPAFCKTQKQKAQAMSGYQKLYSRIFKLLDADSVLVAASCTKYVSLEELLHIVEVQARHCGRKIWLRDLGVQAADHPFVGLKDNSCYIKYALYSVE